MEKITDKEKQSLYLDYVDVLIKRTGKLKIYLNVLIVMVYLKLIWTLQLISLSLV